MSKAFASSGDLGPKQISFSEIGPGCYAFTAEGDPNSGVIVGDDSVMVIDAQATPAMAEQVIERVRQVTDKPIRYVVLTSLPCRARARRVGLPRRRDPRLGRHPGADRRAWQGGLGQRIRPVSAAVPGGRVDSRPDLADHDLPRASSRSISAGAGSS